MQASIVLLALCGCVFARPERSPAELDEYKMHPKVPKSAKIQHLINPKEITADFWNNNAQNILRQKLNKKTNENIAKNVILFLGDGLSIPTLAGTRVYLGGEEIELGFEKLPHTALAKTYCVDYQTPDSACTATAYLAGIKNNMATIGVTAAVDYEDCDGMLQEQNQILSIARWSQDVGKRTGIVTTSTITDASPAGAYAHIANRDWQSDSDVIYAGKDPSRCRDIAYQLIKWDTGKKFNVILGGGSKKFLPTGTVEASGARGERSDGLNLIEEWLQDRAKEGNKAAYVWNRTALLEATNDMDYMLGFFDESYMPYNLDRDAFLTPSLEEMTEAAIKIASRGNGEEDGYFLFIEGGRIDHAHHETWAKRSFDETVEFDKAIEKALELTSEEDTLIVVTADHAHTMSISGYPPRFHDVLGKAGTDDFGIARLTINYANGPGFVDSGHDFGNDNTTDKDYRFPSVSSLYSETHGGDDVGIFASGPWAHLFTGVLEQNTIPHFMAYASCVGDGLTTCSGAMQTTAFLTAPVLIVALLLHSLT